MDFLSFASGAATLRVAAYAMRTIPIQKNPYVAWLVGILQYAVANVNSGRKNMQFSRHTFALRRFDAVRKSRSK